MGQSDQQKYGNMAAQDEAILQQWFWDKVKPQYGALGKDLMSELSGGFNAIPPSVKEAFEESRTGINQSYGEIDRSMRAQMGQQVLQSGNPYTTSQIGSAQAQMSQGLNSQRESDIAQNRFQEGQVGLGQFNNLMGFLGGTANSAMSLNRGFSNLRNQAVGGMNGTSPWGGFLGGAASGASAGAMTGNPWGAVIGGVAGGALGYFGSR